MNKNKRTNHTNSEVINVIGERLKELRKAKGIKQEELAEIIGVQKSTVSLYELSKNDPSDKVKITIAKFFNISLDYLIGVIDEPVPYYSKDLFIKLPDDISNEAKYLLSDYLDYLRYRSDRRAIHECNKDCEKVYK